MSDSLARRPNVLFIICDDLNNALLGMGRTPCAPAPNVQRLIRDGVRFTNAHSNCPLCLPSRNSMLSGLHPLRVAMGYRVNGRDLNTFPAAVQDLERVEVVYEEVQGWDEDITHARSFKVLPKAAQDYVRFVEHVVAVPVTMVGVGPEREQLIRRG